MALAVIQGKACSGIGTEVQKIDLGNCIGQERYKYLGFGRVESKPLQKNSRIGSKKLNLK